MDTGKWSIDYDLEAGSVIVTDGVVAFTIGDIEGDEYGVDATDIEGNLLDQMVVPKTGLM